VNTKLRELDNKVSIDNLQKNIAYHFKDGALLLQALTHKSHSNTHNERMEFLGDSILNASIAIYLIKNFPELDEGVLSRTRASLVKGETLASIARELLVGDSLQLGIGELKSGGYKRASILADALEAIIGAVYLESGFERAEQFVINLFKKRLEKDAILSLDKDPKSRLQEYLQAQQMNLPNYEVISVDGKDHEQMFTVICQVEELSLQVKVQGRNRRSAEREAAKKILHKIQNL